MSTWWRHYGVSNGLYVLAILDAHARLAGVAPWYVSPSPAWGRTLRFLGTGEVCSEYLGVLSEPGLEAEVVRAVAGWLVDPATAEERWQRLELTAVDAEDHCTRLLIDELRSRGLMVHQRPGPSCWRLELPPTWEEYVAGLSRHRRRLLRQIENRFLKNGSAIGHDVTHPDELPEAQAVLADLHQRRLGVLGKPGCFASDRFTAFHNEVMYPLLAQGRLGLCWAELDGRPVVVEYLLQGGGMAYSYQCGSDPERGHLSPGHFGNLTILRRAIAAKCQAIDFLRGDEPYKAQWQARQHETLEFRVAARKPSAQLRLRFWLAGSSLKRWAKGFRARTPGSEGQRPAIGGQKSDSRVPDVGFPATNPTEFVGEVEVLDAR